jgi:uncharacterized membrane protein
MRDFMIYLLALLIGVVAGLRAAVAPAVISWAAFLGWLPLDGTWASFMGHWIAVVLLTLAALAELFNDQRPGTGSRKAPDQFGARIISGGFSGAVLGTAGAALVVGLVAGVVGAVIGTYAGYTLRRWLAGAFGQDRPAALVEDAIAILGGLAIAAAL